ncbi:Ubiquitin carboxyl-terminal hydrolase 4 [Nakaseomyces bracarensis]|uniref:Ubiquitin carboxyl-terminal hydrolase n=1 Tax=Nakaseomyces bracarensis TaxID=273131 RepID=A0ABR4NXQ6_9SACH
MLPNTLDRSMGIDELSRVAHDAVEGIIQESREDSQIMTTLKRSNSRSSKKSTQKDFVSNNEMKYLLDKCLDHLGKLNEQSKLIKRVSDYDEDKLQLYIDAYYYYKVIHILVTVIIPNLPDFQKVKKDIHKKSSNIESELLQIYNIILQTLVGDEMLETVHKIKNVLRQQNDTTDRKYTGSNITSQVQENVENHAESTNGNDSKAQMPYICQSTLDNQSLMDHLNKHRDDTLIIDVRQRQDFDVAHIDTANIICLEPISFKENYSFNDLAKKSMITAPKDEILLFTSLEDFRFVIISANLSDADNDIKSKVDNLKIILSQYHENSLHKDGKVQELLIHNDRIEGWKENGFPIYNLEVIEDDSVISDTSLDEEEEVSIENIEKAGKQKEMDDSVYVCGDTRSLSLQMLPELTPSISSSMDSTMRQMMTPHSISHDLTNLHQQDRMRKVKRSSSFKNFFSLSKSTMLGSHSRSNSTPMSESNLAPFRSISNPNRYPDTPRLQTSFDISSPSVSISYPNSPIVKNGRTPVMSPIAISQVSPGNTRVQGYESNTNSPRQGRIPSGGLSKDPLSPSRMNKLMQNGNDIKQVENKADLNFIVGLENMGNSCYMNCILQCVMGTNELTQIFLNNSYEKHININSKLGSKGVLARYFSRLVHVMHEKGAVVEKKKVAAVRPTQFRMAIASINSLFRNTSQQDCQEFCQFLLDGLHEDLNQCGNNPPLKELSEEAEKKRETLSLRIASSIEWERFLTTNFSVIVDLFQGQYASRLRCQICNTTSTTYQPFSVLSVPVPQKSGAINLLECFNEFTKCETLEVDEQWNCPKCKKKQPSTKQLTITRLPRNLIIHLKRFDNRMNKNNIFVKYPFTLDLTSYWASDSDGKLPPGVSDDELPTRGQIPPFRYRLYAVANHYGSLYGGHYTSYVNKGITRGWYYFDDQNAKVVKNSNDAVNSNAYVLFYHRIHGI